MILPLFLIAIMCSCGGNSTKNITTNDSIKVDTTMVDTTSIDSTVCPD